MADRSSRHTGLKDEAPRVRALRTLRQWIESGELPSGEPLPPERELSRKLQVGRATLQRALSVLEDEGLIRFHGGHTRLVAGRRTSAAGAMLRSAVAVLSYFRDVAMSDRRDAWTEVTCRGAIDEVRERGWNALSFYLDRMTPQNVAELAADRPLGVVIPESNYPSNRISTELFAKLVECAVPFVVCGDWPEWSTFDRVFSDHELGAYEMTRWLVGQGCRRILMLWPEPLDIWWPQGRWAGYLRALAEVGVPVLPVQKMVPLPQGGWGEAWSLDRFEAEARYFAGYLVDHLRQNVDVDAIMLPTDLYSYPVAAACRMLGRVPNEDVIIAGYDNTWATSPYRKFEPVGPAVTVDRLNAQMGREMVRLLADRSEGTLGEPGEARRIAPKLVITGELRRTSEGPCPIC
jgi:DNA-binding LacI/PurR family transcriptional regulator